LTTFLKVRFELHPLIFPCAVVCKKAINNIDLLAKGVLSP
jgi:hypothetical protein